MSSVIVFEQPLNEQVRHFLRLEHVLARAHYHAQHKSSWDVHGAVCALLDISSLVARADYKRELIKELERQSANLRQMQSIPQINHQRLESTLKKHQQLTNILRSSKETPGQHLRESEFLTVVEKKLSVAGGTADFELPAYHRWMTDCSIEQHTRVQNWLQPFDTMRDANLAVLQVIRDSADLVNTKAEQGFFQLGLNADRPIQMIRVGVMGDSRVYPEISVGKHRVAIRLLAQPQPQEKAKQIQHDLKFGLACCAI